MEHNFSRASGFSSPLRAIASLLLPITVGLRRIRESHALCLEEFHFEVHKVMKYGLAIFSVLVVLGVVGLGLFSGGFAGRTVEAVGVGVPVLDVPDILTGRPLTCTVTGDVQVCGQVTCQFVTLRFKGTPGSTAEASCGSLSAECTVPDGRAGCRETDSGPFQGGIPTCVITSGEGQATCVFRHR